MSAFLLDDDLIETLAVWSFGSYDHPTLEGINERARHLYELNIESLSARYTDVRENRLASGMVWHNGRTQTTTGREIAIREFDPRVVVQAARCADYQCCEFDDYKSRPGYAVIERALYHATTKLLGNDDDLQWGSVPEIKDRGQVSLFELSKRGRR